MMFHIDDSDSENSSVALSLSLTETTDRRCDAVDLWPIFYIRSIGSVMLRLRVNLAIL